MARYAHLDPVGGWCDRRWPPRYSCLVACPRRPKRRQAAAKASRAAMRGEMARFPMWFQVTRSGARSRATVPRSANRRPGADDDRVLVVLAVRALKSCIGGLSILHRLERRGWAESGDWISCPLTLAPHAPLIVV